MIKKPELLDIKRKITNKGIRKLISFFPSKINKALIACESNLELDLLPILEMDRSIQSYTEQPHKLSYYDGPKRRWYTPDFLINQSGVETVVEVKPKDKIKKCQEKLKEVETAYSLLGKRFIVITDLAIQKEPRLSNSKFIYRHANQKVSKSSAKALIDLLKNTGTMTIESALTQLASISVELADILKLIYVGIIKFDIAKPLDRNSVIWLSENIDA